MPVMKFGGSSLADSERIRTVADIILDRKTTDKKPPVVVVSAMKGVTNALIDAAQIAVQGQRSYIEALDALKIKHREAIEHLISCQDARGALISEIDGILDEAGDILHGVELVRECSPRTNDLVSGFGERLSSLILAAHLTSRGETAEAVDARQIIRTDDTHGRAIVDFDATGTLVRNRLSKLHGIPIVTGFIASTEDGVVTTLGRNGSDYTATILGAALNIDSVEIWTDVDGILTADPRIVPDAWVINEISFQEAMELSFFGAEVIHPYTLVPVIEKDLPVYIKNTYNPAASGTRIAGNVSPKKRPITGIAAIDDVAMITVEGGGMVGMPGVAGRVFASVAATGVNVIMISQASSEHSICFVCRKDEAKKAVEMLRNDLVDVFSSRVVRDIKFHDGLVVVAVIGENMRGRVGLSGKLFNALGNSGVNILAIAQGSTELNISFVIDGVDKNTAITAIHRAFID